jgi:anti-sigma regulatory factor (Ser/Thr protein kinase)
MAQTGFGADVREGLSARSASDPRLVHRVLLYHSPKELAATVAPFLREGLERGDTVVAGVRAAGVEALREELGPDAERVELHDTLSWHPRPFDRLRAVDRTIRALPPGREARILGEPIWNGSEAVRREWARYEAIINSALAHAPLRFICLYDAAGLPQDLLDHGRRTHPELVEPSGRPCACGTFVPPADYVAALGPGPIDHAAEDLPLNGDQYAFRMALAERADAHGLGPGRVEELVLAATEVTSNALIYGRPPLRARLWSQAGELMCEVSDCGDGIADPMAGWRIPDPTAIGGWGLPLTRELCDALDIVSDSHGTRVRLHMSLNGD